MERSVVKAKPQVRAVTDIVAPKVKVIVIGLVSDVYVECAVGVGPVKLFMGNVMHPDDAPGVIELLAQPGLKRFDRRGRYFPKGVYPMGVPGKQCDVCAVIAGGEFVIFYKIFIYPMFRPMFRPSFNDAGSCFRFCSIFWSWRFFVSGLCRPGDYSSIPFSFFTVTRSKRFFSQDTSPEQS
jgi:hypothetical protein